MKPKKQIIVALTIIFLITIPLAISHVSVASTPNPAISAVASGSSSTSSITVNSNPNPLYTTVAIDVRIDNSPAIWGWAVSSVTWNSTVLNLIKVVRVALLP